MREMGIKIGPTAAPLPREERKQVLGQSLGLVKHSTASLGKFTEKLRDEPRNLKFNKQKSESIGGNIAEEKRKSMHVLEKMFGKEDILDKNRAANAYIADEQDNNRKQKKFKAAGFKKKASTKKKAIK